VSEQQPSRIEDARRRALAAKQKLVATAAAAFVVAVGLAWSSHPGGSTASGTTPVESSSSGDGSQFPDEGESDDFGGFDSFGSIAPSGSEAPLAQTHVS